MFHYEERNDVVIPVVFPFVLVKLSKLETGRVGGYHPFPEKGRILRLHALFAGSDLMKLSSPILA